VACVTYMSFLFEWIRDLFYSLGLWKKTVRKSIEVCEFSAYVTCFAGISFRPQSFSLV
jgi:hypothetical protein